MQVVTKGIRIPGSRPPSCWAHCSTKHDSRIPQAPALLRTCMFVHQATTHIQLQIGQRASSFDSENIHLLVRPHLRVPAASTQRSQHPEPPYPWFTRVHTVHVHQATTHTQPDYIHQSDWTRRDTLLLYVCMELLSRAALTLTHPYLDMLAASTVR